MLIWELRLYIIILKQKQLLSFMARFRYIYTGVISHTRGYYTITFTDGLLVRNSFCKVYCIFMAFIIKSLLLLS